MVRLRQEGVLQETETERQLRQANENHLNGDDEGRPPSCFLHLLPANKRQTKRLISSRSYSVAANASLRRKKRIVVAVT